MRKELRRKPYAFIFDLDGVIVDSMPYHFLSWHEALRPFGVRVNCIDVYQKEGAKWDKALEYFLQKANIKPTRKILNGIFKEHKKSFKKIFKRYIFDDALPIIEKIKKKGYKIGLVTGTNAKRVKRILPAKIYNMFDSIITGDSVKKGKPHPDPYLKAAKKLNVSPSDCVVIENAPFGIESAKKAGMFCIALTTSLPKEYLSGADKIVDNLFQISSII
ncbi:MAG: HAD family phosphatase [Elusimicrobia bacterium]|nr:HAD family phosphatase [Elusimicrobiota bacterium]